MAKATVKLAAYKHNRPNSYGHFKNLSLERVKLLDKLSVKNKLDELAKSEIKLQGLVSYKDLAAEVGRSVKWCRHKIGELKIKHAREIRKVRYFNEDIVDRLLGEKGSDKK